MNLPLHSAELISLMRQIVPVSEADIQLIEQSFTPVTAKKHEVLVDYNKTARHMYFVVSGYARVYHLERGIEVTNHIASENFFVTAYNSFTTKKPSEEVVQTINACELLQVTKEDLDALYRKSHNLALFGLYMADQYLVFNNHRAKDLITLNAEEKYQKLLDESPHILQNVPLQYISSYIGMEPQTLSRIRRKMSGYSGNLRTAIRDIPE